MGPGTRCFPYHWVLLRTYEFITLFYMTSLHNHCILGLSEVKSLHPRDKEHLAIRRTFSLVDMITNTKFSNCPNVFEIGVVWQ